MPLPLPLPQPLPLPRPLLATPLICHASAQIAGHPANVSSELQRKCGHSSMAYHTAPHHPHSHPPSPISRTERKRNPSELSWTDQKWPGHSAIWQHRSQLSPWRLIINTQGVKQRQKGHEMRYTQRKCLTKYSSN